jgi:GH15 family glucan-1,4-alpha-glucosidase
MSEPAASTPARIEDYALIGNTRTAALVSRQGSIDWWCIPRFDSAACFAALLGDRRHGRWLIGAAHAVQRTTRGYRPGTLILETEVHTGEGCVRLIDFMPMREGRLDIVRIVQGVRGEVPLHFELVIRFGYGEVIPWVRREGHTLIATGGPDTLALRTPVELQGVDYTTQAHFTVREGERVPFVLTHSPSHEPRPVPIDAEAALEGTELWWHAWSSQTTYHGEHDRAVHESLTVLKALSYAPSGGIVAAPTTSLPEAPGGVRTWDDRFGWVRDSTFTLYALLLAGYREEARAWREWLLRAAAGRPQDLQVLYGVTGDRVRAELTIPWLPGYAGARPVRIGNAAAVQCQLDVYGELIDTLCLARSAGLAHDADAWTFQRTLLDWLESHWSDPDSGIWEMRGERQRFTHSRVMSWVAMDRSIKDAERLGLDGPVEQWKRTRAAIRHDVLTHGYDAKRGTFVQRYGADALDAALLLIPIVGFLPATDERVRGTVAAIERDLTVDGLVQRYRTEDTPDGLPVGEGLFLPCSFWMVDALWLMGRERDARKLYERLLGLRNDVGLLAEEYDPRTGRMLGNFPQALSHVALVNSARNLASRGGPSEHRSGGMKAAPPGGTHGHRHAPTHSAGVETVPVQPAHLDTRGDPQAEKAARERTAGHRNQAGRRRVANDRR